MNNINLRKSVFITFLTLLVLTMSAPSFAQTKKDIKKSNDLVGAGNKDFRLKNYRAAIDKYSQAIAIVPKNATAYFWKGYAHYYLKETDQAIAELGRASTNGYTPIEIQKIRWYLNYEKKDYDAALIDLTAAMKAEPANPTLIRAAADINFEKGNFQEALKGYQSAIISAPNDGDLYYNIAKTYQGLGDSSGQLKAAEDAIAKRTRYLAEAHFLVGYAYQKQGKRTESAAAFRKAVEAKPDNYAAYRNLAEIYRAENRYDEAIEISKRGLRQFPLDGNLYTDISWYYSLAGKNEEAIQAAQAGIKILPNQYMAYTNLCRAYNEVNKPELAIRECNNALKINPNDGETHFYLGRAYDMIGKAADATRSYGKAVAGLIESTKNDSSNSDGFYLLGNAYFANNQRDKAIEAYRKCLELSPKYVKARYNMGIIQVLQKNKPGAMEQYNSLMPLDQSLAGKLKTEIDKL